MIIAVKDIYFLYMLFSLNVFCQSHFISLVGQANSGLDNPDSPVPLCSSPIGSFYGNMMERVLHHSTLAETEHFVTIRAKEHIAARRDVP